MKKILFFNQKIIYSFCDLDKYYQNFNNKQYFV